MKIDFTIRLVEHAMKRRFPKLVVCLSASLTSIAGGLCYGEDNVPSANATSTAITATPSHSTAAPADSEVPVPAPFAGGSPWSEPPVSASSQVPIAPTTLIPSPPSPPNPSSATDSPLGAAVPRLSEFVSEDDVSAAIRGIAQQAAQLTAEGLRLAGKGAAFSARAKFIGALQLIADALDARHQTQSHSRALAAGLLALKEADDFARADSPTAGAGSDPVTRASGHSTPVLKATQRNSVTRLQALQLYYAYATSQFSAAVGGIPEGSTALYYLGRLQPFLGESIDRAPVLAEPKALALQQAAVVADPKNYRASNELGVLLAHCGQLDSARKALLFSASIERHPEIFQNLALVYDALADHADAELMKTLAAEEQRRNGGSSVSAARPLIYLVDHKTFEGEKPIPESASANHAAATSAEVSRARGITAQSYQSPLNGGAGEEFLSPLSWEVFAQGEYIGPARLPHVPDYFLRVDDTLTFVFRLNGRPSAGPYRLNVGDVVRIGSLTTTSPAMESPIQPDGTIVLPQVGPVVAAGKSIDALRLDLDQKYRQFIREPAITVVPVSINRTVEELRAAIINRAGIYAGQSFTAKVAPNGTVSLPGLGPVPAQGLTLPELRGEVEQRYAELVSGVEITPVLTERAPRSVYVLGEVQKPGKYPLDAPTTVIQSIALAGSWNIGGNLKSVIVFRRDDQWRLMATRVNVRPALYNSRSLQADDIWLRDSDIVIVPKSCLQVFDDWVSLVFTKGIYGIVPFQGIAVSFFKDLTTIGALSP